MPESILSWLVAGLIMVAGICYTINSVTWLIGAWDKTTALQKLRVDLMAFFPGKFRNEPQLRRFRFRLATANVCLVLATGVFVLSYVMNE